MSNFTSSLDEHEAQVRRSRESMPPGALASRRALSALIEGEVKARRFYRKTRRELSEEAFNVLQRAKRHASAREVSSEAATDAAQSPSTVQDLPSTTEERGSSACPQKFLSGVHQHSHSKHSDEALDGLGLYADDLLKPASELVKKPTIWWTDLGKDDKERGKAFHILSQTRMEWEVFAREALGRALGDVHAYEFNPVRTKLLPPKKKRVIKTKTSCSFPNKEKKRLVPKTFSSMYYNLLYLMSSFTSSLDEHEAEVRRSRESITPRALASRREPIMYDDEYMPQLLTLSQSNSGDDLTLMEPEMRFGTTRSTTRMNSYSTADKDERGPTNIEVWQRRKTEQLPSSTDHHLASNSFSDVIANAMQENAVSLPKLGKILRQFNIDVANKEILHTRMENTSVNLEHVKKMLDNIETMRSSSDSVVRALTAVVREQSQFIAGLATVVDCILAKQQEQARILQKISYHVAKNGEKWLPEGYIFERRNITRTWILREEKPFKEVNMLELFESWTSSTRAVKRDQFLRILDFYRHYLVSACDPVTEIQHYACRMTGKKGKFEHLMDLPESLATFLISFAMDGLGLYADDLLKPASELMKKPTIWWTNLGKDDKERRKTFDILSQTRMEWAVFAREALGRALGDVRAYKFDPVRSKLLPPKKKRVIETTGDSSFPTNEIEKIKRKALSPL